MPMILRCCSPDKMTACAIVNGPTCFISDSCVNATLDTMQTE